MAPSLCGAVAAPWWPILIRQLCIPCTILQLCCVANVVWRRDLTSSRWLEEMCT